MTGFTVGASLGAKLRDLLAAVTPIHMKSKPMSVNSARLLAFYGCSVLAVTSTLAANPNRVQVISSYHNDVSRPLREMAATDQPSQRQEREAAENPKIPNSHVDSPDPVIEKGSVLHLLAPSIPAPILNFDGIPFPGVGCSCAPPDPNGAVGLTQYVQMVNEGYQVFDKATGNSVLGPNSIVSLWSGFGGACQTGGFGDPVVLYDQLADRWVISQFASATGGTPITDECVAVSTSGDATGAYNRYGFHLGSNFFDYPKISVWPDAYYMSMNVFNSAGTAYLGPQPFAFDRTSMLAGAPATFISPVGPLGGSVPPFLPANLDGFTLPPAGAPNTFLRLPEQQQIHGLSLPCGLCDTVQLNLHHLRYACGGGLYPALSHHALLRAGVGCDFGEQTRRHRRPADVPAGLS